MVVPVVFGSERRDRRLMEGRRVVVVHRARWATTKTRPLPSAAARWPMIAAVRIRMDASIVVAVVGGVFVIVVLLGSVHRLTDS
jgi:hypothetical protein